MSDDYLWDKTGEPDPDVARLEKALAPLRHQAEWREPVRTAAAPPSGALDVVAAPPLAQGVATASPPAAPEIAMPSRVAHPRPVFRRPAWIAGGALALAAGIALALFALRPGPDRGGPLAGVDNPYSTPSSSTAAGVPAPLPTQAPAAPPVCSPAAEGFAWQATSPVDCGGAPASTGNLPAGTWMETGEGATASLQVADIGSIQLHGGSKLRIVATGAKEHRLELVRGSLHAKVKAPPRLFVIDTRAATAVDLGCEYDLRIDDRGRSHLRVTSGAVSLEGKGRAAYVPAGTATVADPDRGPGVVIAEGATPELTVAAAQLDAGDAGALAELLVRAGQGDSFTLWNLLPGASREDRGKVLRRMEELKMRPAKVKREAVLAGQPEALLALRTSLEDAWFEPTPGKGR